MVIFSPLICAVFPTPIVNTSPGFTVTAILLAVQPDKSIIEINIELNARDNFLNICASFTVKLPILFHHDKGAVTDGRYYLPVLNTDDGLMIRDYLGEHLPGPVSMPGLAGLIINGVIPITVFCGNYLRKVNRAGLPV